MDPGLAAPDTVKLELPVSPTPLPSTGAGVSKAIALRGSLFDFAGPLDAVIDILGGRRL